MKKGMRRILVMLLALSMVFSTLALPAFAADGTDRGKPVITELEIENEQAMFKAVSASLETYPDGSRDLVFALSGTGYIGLYKGTYPEAVQDKDAIVAALEANESTDKTIVYQMNADDKYEFRIPLDEGQTYIPLISVSSRGFQNRATQPIEEKGFYARQVELKNDGTKMWLGDYNETSEFTLSTDLDDFKAETVVSTTIKGGPVNNNYSVAFTITMKDGTYDSVTYPSVVNNAVSTKTTAVKGGKFVINMENAPNKKAFQDKTPLKFKFHVSKDAHYKKAGTDVERIVTFDQVAKTITVTGTPLEPGEPADYNAVKEAKAKVPADLSIYTAASRKAVEDALAAVVTGKGIEEQAAVNAMAKAINDAVASLKIDIAKAKVTGLSNQTYSGEALKPAPTVTVKGKTLKENTDYTVAYKNNTNAGTATVTITGKNKCAGSKTVSFTIDKKAQSITGPAATLTKTYGGKAFSLNAKTNGGGKLTYKSNNTKVAAVSSTGKVTIKGAGTAKITISTAATANYKAGSKTVTIKVNKAANKMKASGKTVTVSYSKLKKDKQTVTKAKAFAVKNNNGKVTFTKKKGNAKITVSKAGKITVKKGLKKGTYKVKVKVKAAGNSNYKAKTKTVTVTIKVK